MATITAPEEQLMPAIAFDLNESRGVVAADELKGIPFDPEERSNITMLAGAIGVALAETPRDAADTDQALQVYRNDFRIAELGPLSDGLYVPYDSPRYKKTDRLIKLRGVPLSLDALGVVTPSTGVVVGKGEFKVIARSAPDLAAHAKATTRDANADNLNREEVEEKAGRSAAHTLDSKLVGLARLDETLIEQSDVLRSIFRDAKLIWRTAYLTKNLNGKRREADELIHDTAEIAANSLGYGTTAINAIHRALTSNLYRRGSSTELAESWRDTTVWTGRYLNAKRGKVNQSTNATKQERAQYNSYLPQAA